MNLRRSFPALLMLSTTLAGVSCGGDGPTTPPVSICDMLEDYTASTTTPLTFTTDIQPIIMSSADRAAWCRSATATRPSPSTRRG